MTRLLRERTLSRIAKEKKPEQVRRKEGPSKSEMQKETILKAREISIEHLRKVPGRFLAADKNLLQTFHRGADTECVGDGLDTGCFGLQKAKREGREEVPPPTTTRTGVAKSALALVAHFGRGSRLWVLKSASASASAVPQLELPPAATGSWPPPTIPGRPGCHQTSD